MNLEKVKEALQKKFSAPLGDGAQRRIVFWYDEEGEFNPWLETLELRDVKILRLDNNYFDLKRTLEKIDTTSNYLIYSPKAPPHFQENWLLDIELYSDSFSADRASILLDELNIEVLSLKDIIRRNIKFFDSQERMRAFLNLGIPCTTEEDIDLGILSVVSGCKTASVESIIRSVLLESLHENENRLFEQLRRYPGEEAFWNLASELCGYDSETPSLKHLFHSLLLTATTGQLAAGAETGWEQYLLPKRNNVQVFIDHWMNHKDHSAVFEDLARQSFQELELKRQMDDLKAEEVLDADTFEFFDLLVISSIVQGLTADNQDFDTWQSWISRRKAGHWYEKYRDCYLALEAGIELFKFKWMHEGGFQEPTAIQMLKRYVGEYFRADQLYRRFSLHQGRVNSDILHGLADNIENLYVNWFLDGLAVKWQELVADSLTEEWRIPEVPQQQEFFSTFVKSIATEKTKDKAFVIISDGLRHEAAEQLARELEQETRSKPMLDYMQGVVPSYTELGMSVLLPHRQIEYSAEGAVQVDGVTASAGNREKILKAGYEKSTVLAFKNLMTMTKEEARAAIGENRVIYIYHNTIDNVGDKAATEHKTFQAVDDAIDEIKRGVKKICNSLNGTHVVITADHGFLYQRDTLPESDKIALDGKGGIASGRRFILTKSGETIDGTTEISMDYLLGKDSGLSVYSPNGIIRFKCSGGMRYVHGGSSLQEIVIPLLRYTHVRRESKRAVEVSKVDIELTNTERKIPTSPYVFNFFQKEKTGTKLLPRRLRVAIWDLEDKEEKVSTEEILVADHESERASERTFAIHLNLKTSIKNKDYYLRLIDDETGLEYKRIRFAVKLGIPKHDFWG